MPLNGTLKNGEKVKFCVIYVYHSNKKRKIPLWVNGLVFDFPCQRQGNRPVCIARDTRERERPLISQVSLHSIPLSLCSLSIALWTLWTHVVEWACAGPATTPPSFCIPSAETLFLSHRMGFMRSCGSDEFTEITLVEVDSNQGLQTQRTLNEWSWWVETRNVCTPLEGSSPEKVGFSLSLFYFSRWALKTYSYVKYSYFKCRNWI